MAIWFLFAAFAAVFLTGFLSFYLDFRRYNLVQLGQLPASTPELFRWTWGLGLSQGLQVLEYVFSKDFAQSPDPPTRFWVPILRLGYIASSVLFALAAATAFWRTG